MSQKWYRTLVPPYSAGYGGGSDTIVCDTSGLWQNLDCNWRRMASCNGGGSDEKGMRGVKSQRKLNGKDISCMGTISSKYYPIDGEDRNDR